MPPKFKRKVRKGTLHYALEICDRTQLVTVISKTDLDGKAGLEVLNVIKKSREVYKDSITPLQGAVSLGHYNICKQLVEEGAVLQSASTIPHPLCLALQKKHYTIARLLIEAGADITLAFDEKLPMGYALDDEECTLQIVQDIIDAGFPVNSVVHYTSGKTTLHAAVNMNHTSIVKYLLSLPIDANVRDKRGLTPLHYAVQKNYTTMVKLLVKAGAIIDCECQEHFTPMFYAIATGNYDMVKLLLSLGADIHYVNGNKRCSLMPLHFAANFCKFKITQLLLEKGADVNKAIPLTGEIPIHSAARADTQNNQQNKVSLDCITELLIKEGSNMEARHKFGLTPLQSAIKAKNLSVAKMLIINGANLNTRISENDDRCYTTFHLAAKTFDKDLIKMCLDYGADYLSKDSEGMYPCHMSLITTIVDVLAHSADCQQSLHCTQSHCDQLLIFKLFWRHGFPFDLTLDIKWLKNSCPAFPTKIASAVQKQKMLFNGVKALQLKTVQKAVAQGAEVKSCSKEMRSPLHYIAGKGDENILREFVSRAVSVNALNKNGETPLHHAARGGYVNCCRILLEHGAVYNYCSLKSPKTPLDLAKQNKHTEVVTLLTTVDKYFKDIKKGHFKKLKPSMKIFGAVMNCSHKDGRSLMGRAIHLDMKESATRLMKFRLQVAV